MVTGEASADGRFGFKFDPRCFGVPPAPAPALENVACPTLVVRGADSSLLTPEGAADLVSDLPRAQLAEIEGAGHHAQIERPAAVVAAVGRFLNEVGFGPTTD